jgi:arginine dihydrolase
MNVRAPPTAEESQPRFLMCPPHHFAVNYRINPWMDPQAWADCGTPLQLEAQRQWTGLRSALLAAGAVVETLQPAPGLPDLVFTANAAVLLDRKVLLSRFRYPERRDEEPIFAAALRALGDRDLIDEIVLLPPGIFQEGAGDCIWDPRRRLFWMGCGFRSDLAAARVFEKEFGVPCRSLPLAHARFYHLDTAFCALPCGSVIYYPSAFAPAALERIHTLVAPAERIALEEAEAMSFAANAVCVHRTIVLSSCSPTLRSKLRERGYLVTESPLHAFLRSGGSACCLTLRLDHRSAAKTAAATGAAGRDGQAAGSASA